MYVWFMLPTYPNFFNPTLHIKMVFGEKIPKMGTFSDFVTIFFDRCYILTHLAYRANGDISDNNSQLKCVIADVTGK